MFLNSCYFAINTDVTYETAYNACVSLESSLLKIDNITEISQLKMAFPEMNPFVWVNKKKNHLCIIIYNNLINVSLLQ